ncbi:MAG: RimK family protein [Ectothiorhodospiraceae bacterium]|nr:RimK family protein [Ectothiorhodospiraceae bacterium]MCH8504674.1 RimK family protein [Ectothiorhodospiraceae bacterium]
MAEVIIVVEDLRDWKPYYPSEQVITADDYLFGAPGSAPSGARVLNLCRSYKYLSLGYYCSLLAEARNHKVIPTVRTINDLSHRAIYSLETEDLDASLQKLMQKAGTSKDDRYVLDIYFGKTRDAGLADLARQIFETFTAPLLRVEFRHQGKWRISGIRSGALHKLSEDQEDTFAEALDSFSRHVWRRQRQRRRYRYDMAILHDPEEKLPPSNPRALKNFVRVGRSLGIDVELIQKRDFAQLGEYDALLIRETTAISDHTYRFAKKAESEGLVVMDDPNSILRCTNKVYLADLLRTNAIATPKTRILHHARPNDLKQLGEELGFPMVLKIPDGSFSRGVVKVEGPDRLAAAADELFRRSDLILAQEYLFTEYDWRIGVLNRKPIFACQYYMSKGHWQIVQHGPKGQFKEGGARTFPTTEAPQDVVRLAVKAASLIGDGLYGVDVKQTTGRQVVIEVNDNPNLDAGIEDGYLKDDLYRIILEEFLRRLERKRMAVGQA